MHLFHESLHSCLQAKFDSVAQWLAKRSLNELSAPNLAGTIQTLWESAKPQIPTIYADRRHGTARDNERHVRRHGQYTHVTERVIDVWVPFDGDGRMFSFRPSTCQILQEPVSVEGGHLRYTMPFDPDQQDGYRKLLDQIAHNLEVMRRDVEAFGREAVDRLNRLAAERRAELEAEAEAAKRFDFPVS